MNQQFMSDESAEMVVAVETEEQATWAEEETQSETETINQSAIVEQMTADIRQVVGSRNLRRNLYLLGSLALIWVFYLLESIPAFTPEIAQQVSAASKGYLLFVLLCTPVAILFIERAYRRRTCKKTGSVETIDDLRMVGPLAEMLAIESLPVRRVAKANLTRLLPQLKASDTALLNGVQRKQLNRFVRPDLFNPGQRDIMELFSRSARQRDIDFQLAIFKAYEQVGDWRSLKAVRSVACTAFGLRRGVPSEICEEALRCLTFLEMAVEKENVGRQLLRPSSASDVMPDTLLRAASHLPTEGAETLLRATNVPDEK